MYVNKFNSNRVKEYAAWERVHPTHALWNKSQPIEASTLSRRRRKRRVLNRLLTCFVLFFCGGLYDQAIFLVRFMQVFSFIYPSSHCLSGDYYWYTKSDDIYVCFAIKSSLEDPDLCSLFVFWFVTDTHQIFFFFCRQETKAVRLSKNFSSLHASFQFYLSQFSLSQWWQYYWYKESQLTYMFVLHH